MTESKPLQFKRTANISTTTKPASSQKPVTQTKRSTRSAGKSVNELMDMWVQTFGEPAEVLQKLRDAGVDVPEPIVLKEPQITPNQKLYRYHTEIPKTADPKVAKLIRMWESLFVVDADGNVVTDGMGLAIQERVKQLETRQKEDIKRQWAIEAMKRNPRYKVLEAKK
jgi:hypothetical protein